MEMQMAGSDAGRCRGEKQRGFTLFEVLLAVAILSVVSAVTYFTFSTVVTGWRRGQALVEHLHHGDFVIEQLAMALRSTYFPETGGKSTGYGFILDDDGSGGSSSDVISWVKLGSALVGKDCPFAGTPHRVDFFVDENEDGEPVAAVKAWRLDGQPEDFDPDDDVEPVFLSRQVRGFNCRTIMEEDVDEDGDIEWQDEWDFTNDLPLAVEITLYLEPIERNGDPVELSRIVEIPVAYLSDPWTDTSSVSGGDDESDESSGDSGNSDSSESSESTDSSSGGTQK